MPAMTINRAAAELGVSPSTLRRWIAQGAPVARRGAPGRGKGTLVDSEAVRKWRDAPAANAALLKFAAKIPEILAACAVLAHRLAPDKRGAAWTACCYWQISAQRLQDHLRYTMGLDIGDIDCVPLEIERLRKNIPKNE